MVELLTEHSLPGSDCPASGVFPLLLFVALRCPGCVGRPVTDVNQDQKDHADDYRHRQSSAGRIPQAGQPEIHAGGDCPGCPGQIVQTGTARPDPGSDRRQSLRNLDDARAGTGPRPGTLVRGRTTVATELRGARSAECGVRRTGSREARRTRESGIGPAASRLVGGGSIWTAVSASAAECAGVSLRPAAARPAGQSTTNCRLVAERKMHVAAKLQHA